MAPEEYGNQVLFLRWTSDRCEFTNYNLGWESVILPILQEQYSLSLAKKVYKDIVQNDIFKSHFEDGVYRLGEAKETVLQLTKNGWVILGKYADYKIKENELKEVLLGQVSEEMAEEISSKVISRENEFFTTTEYKAIVTLNVNGYFYTNAWSPVVGMEEVLNEYYSEKFVKKNSLKYLGLLFGCEFFYGMVLCKFDKKTWGVVSEKDVHLYKNSDMLKKHIMSNDPPIDADKFCKKAKQKCIKIAEEIQGNMQIKKVLYGLKVWQYYGEGHWYICDSSLKQIEKEIREKIYGGDCDPDQINCEKVPFNEHWYNPTRYVGCSKITLDSLGGLQVSVDDRGKFWIRNANGSKKIGYISSHYNCGIYLNTIWLLEHITQGIVDNATRGYSEDSEITLEEFPKK